MMTSTEITIDDRPGTPRGGTSSQPPESAGASAALSVGLVSPAWPLDAYPNGIITYVANVAEGMRSLGHRPTILAQALAAGDWGDSVYDSQSARSSRSMARRVLDGLGYRVAPRWVSERISRRELLATTRRAIAERGLQILEMEESFGLAGWLQRAIPIPVCIRLHGPWFLNGAALGMAEDNGFRRRVAREGWAIRQASAVTAPSLDVLEQTRAYYSLALEEAVVIPNPTYPVAPAERWRLARCDPKQVLFIGRFDRHKGGDLIVEAFAKVLRAVPDARLCFVGPDVGLASDDGRRWDVAGYIDDRLPGARESGRVNVMGKVPNSKLDELRREAIVTVACSRYEVFGIASAEAMAMGCPIVAARVGGIREIIRDGIDGLLHNTGDTDDLAAKILTVLTDPARAAELGRQAAARCEQHFYPAAVAAQTIAFYRRVVRTATTNRSGN
jgi:glycosyltransferase involved in cell wall biosynthesis